MQNDPAEIIAGKIPPLDPTRKYKLLQVARALKKSCYKLQLVHDPDAKDGEQWIVVCIALINGVPYESANHLDKYSVSDHADLFKSAFSNALKDVEAETKSIITLH